MSPRNAAVCAAEGPLISVSHPPDDHHRILDALTALAAEREWTSLTADQVSAAAGLPVATFAAHFASVQEGVQRAVAWQLDRLLERVHEQLRHAGAAWSDRVVAVVVGVLSFVGREPAGAWLAIAEPLADDYPVCVARTSARLRLGLALAEGAVDNRGRVGAGVATDGVRTLWEAARRWLSGACHEDSLDDVARGTIFLILAPHVDRDDALHAARSAPSVEAD